MNIRRKEIGIKCIGISNINMLLLSLKLELPVLHGLVQLNVVMSMVFKILHFQLLLIKNLQTFHNALTFRKFVIDSKEILVILVLSHLQLKWCNVDAFKSRLQGLEGLT